MVFAVFDHDSLVEGLQSIWNEIAPPAMFTAAGNIGASRYSEDFTKALSMVKWNEKVTNMQNGNYDDLDNNHGVTTEHGTSRTGYGFSFGSTTDAYTSVINSQIAAGSNNIPPSPDELGYISQNPADWKQSEDSIYVPAGFAPIRGENVVYADTLPPFDITLTFASEYGNTAFQKIYDVEILNESSGASVDTVVMSRQVTWIARRLSPLIRGVYYRDENGTIIPKNVIRHPSDTD